MSYIPEYHENYYRVEGTAYNQGKIGIGTVNPVQLLHVSGGNFRVDGSGYVNGDLNISGNLNVYGTSAEFAVSQIIAEDKLIELNVQTGGGSAFSDDAGADHGGIRVRSTQGDKEIIYETTSPASGWVSNLRFAVSGNYGKNTLALTDTTADIGITIGSDVNLYRSGANVIATDDTLAVGVNTIVSGYVLKSISPAVSAAGTGQAGATALTRDINNVTSVSASNSGVALPAASAGMDILILNNGANTLNVFPVNGGSAQINSLGANAAFTIAVGNRNRFVATTNTQWYTI